MGSVSERRLNSPEVTPTQDSIAGNAEAPARWLFCIRGSEPAAAHRSMNCRLRFGSGAVGYTPATINEAMGRGVMANEGPIAASRFGISIDGVQIASSGSDAFHFADKLDLGGENETVGDLCPVGGDEFYQNSTDANLSSLFMAPPSDADCEVPAVAIFDHDIGLS